MAQLVIIMATVSDKCGKVLKYMLGYKLLSRTFSDCQASKYPRSNPGCKTQLIIKANRS